MYLFMLDWESVGKDLEQNARVLNHCALTRVISPPKCHQYIHAVIKQQRTLKNSLEGISFL
jgi:hypothetical protein